jgi:hypothetical protein
MELTATKQGTAKLDGIKVGFLNWTRTFEQNFALTRSQLNGAGVLFLES